MESDDEWFGKFCVVTGAASGIGAATTLKLAKLGARVLALDIDEVKLLNSVQSLPENLQSFVIPRICDISSEAEVSALFLSFRTESLSALLNIAALPSPGISIEEMTTDLWDRIMSVNVKGVFLMTKYSLPLFRNNQTGVIVNTSSVHAIASTKNMSAYAASKGALISLTTQLSLDLVGDRVRVVGIAPGSVNTPMTTLDLQSDSARLNALGFPTDGYSLGHVGEPEEIAEAIIWVASSKASFVNGTTIIVDGGLLAKLVN